MEMVYVLFISLTHNNSWNGNYVCIIYFKQYTQPKWMEPNYYTYIYIYKKTVVTIVHIKINNNTNKK